MANPDNSYNVRHLLGEDVMPQDAPSVFINQTVSPVRTALFSFEDQLVAGAGALRIYNHTGRNLTIRGVYLAVGTAPTTNAIIVDISKGGVSIFTTQTNRPQIAAGANTGQSLVINVAGWLIGEYLTCDLDAVGIAGGTGRNLVVEVVVQ